MEGQTYDAYHPMPDRDFYERMRGGAMPTTAQVNPDEARQVLEQALATHDEVLHIAFSSGLSGSCQTAKMLAEDYDGKVEVVNNQRVSVTMVHAVMDAQKLIADGKSAAQVRQILEEEALQSSIYITVTTLKYLRKGGRITPAVAALGTVLRLKPVLQIQGERLDSFAKVRTMHAAKQVMLDAMHKDMDTRFTGCRMRLAIAHTNNQEAAMEFKKEVEAEFPGVGEILVDELSLSVACHIGDGSLAIACSKVVE